MGYLSWLHPEAEATTQLCKLGVGVSFGWEPSTKDGGQPGCGTSCREGSTLESF
jgi:hypothetical protein